MSDERPNDEPDKELDVMMEAWMQKNCNNHCSACDALHYCNDAHA